MEIPHSGVKAICQMVTSDKNEESSTRLVDQLGAGSSIVPPIYACITQLELGNLKQMTKTDLNLAQDKDPDIGPVKLALEQRKVLKAGTSPCLQIALLLKQASTLVIQNELLYRVSKGSCGKEKKSLFYLDSSNSK